MTAPAPHTQIDFTACTTGELLIVGAILVHATVLGLIAVWIGKRIAREIDGLRVPVARLARDVGFALFEARGGEAGTLGAVVKQGKPARELKPGETVLYDAKGERVDVASLGKPRGFGLKPTSAFPFSAEQTVDLLGEAVQAVLDETARPQVQRHGRPYTVTERLRMAAGLPQATARAPHPGCEGCSSPSPAVRTGGEADA